jgi:hypothetical protein
MENQIEVCKNDKFYQFPIMIGEDYVGNKNFPQFHKHDGLAIRKHIKEVSIIGGWGEKQALIPVEIHQWEDGDKYFKSNDIELFVLNSRLIMN